ncbi:hypothetical protein GCM10022248_84910 [Nonomuraea soli]
MGNDAVLCQVCQGVLPATGRDSYTPLRGRLIVTNGYCRGGCAQQRPMPVSPAEEATRQMVRPMPVQNPMQNPMQAPPMGAQQVAPSVRVPL